MQRINAARTGMSRAEFPSSSLRIGWQTSAEARLTGAPLVGVDGETYVVGTRGEVYAIRRDGIPLWRVATDATGPGPAALLSDGTIVFADATGQAVGVRKGAVRFRVPIGRPSNTLPAPLALDDGGVILATANEIAVLDSDGGRRARMSSDETIASSLISALGKVAFVTASGSVWTWDLGERPPARIATFGSAVLDGAALADDHTLVAIGPRKRFSAVDLVRGTSTLRIALTSGHFHGPPAMRAGVGYLALATTSGEYAVAIDPRGAEIGRTLLFARAPAQNVDAGVMAAPSDDTSLLIDFRGTLIFATGAGIVGAVSAVASPAAVVETLSNPCSDPSTTPIELGGSSPIAGLAPLPPNGFVAACRSGTVFSVRSSAR